ncbi:glycoside hydrolase family 65 protein [Companilactobacillus zhachilii]|uniref:glycoside hydrolase family 65 protein n=1 Tax=Companilactobacillus zhachilii TaxID=2304606 RepID=UPI00192395C0|nr:glycoside hydrolase family 65 protein [Companilactobacillus zhachilii]MBL3531957.1 glycoside hydrolase family 65 protein [Companilactobacillus zhachilii]
MKFCVDTNEKNSWYIGTNDYGSKMINKFETVMFQGNGYMGMRAVAEEKQLHEQRDMFISGTFDAFPNEVTELPNLPDLINLEIKIDGQPLCLKDGYVENYHKSLNLKNGELTRTFDWIINNKAVHFNYRRFISMYDKHLFVSQVEVSSAQDELNVQLNSGIDGRQSNDESQHLMEGDKRLYDGQYIQMRAETQQSHIDFVFNVRHKIYVDEVLLGDKPYINMSRRQIFGNYNVDLQAGQTLTFIKYANVYTSIDQDTDPNKLTDDSVAALKRASLSNYNELLQKSDRVWNHNIWQKNYVQIDSEDEKPQVAINFARYQLAANTPLDPRMNIGAKGITGEGYKGHTFWDTEIFMLPYYTFTMPDVAKNLLTYRYLGLQGAHKKAQGNNYQGAQFPWEAADPTDGETAPLWGSADIVTGKPMKIWSGFIEQHVTSDIVIAIMDYLHATGDQVFADDMGYEIILDAAKFWSSRLEYNEERDVYEINDVIGPDEYKEHVDNNAFTNYTARWCIQKAIKVYNLIKEENPELYLKLSNKLNLETTYESWINQVNRIYVPQPNIEGVIPEDDQYLSLKNVDVSKFQVNDQISTIFKTYNLLQINQMQITKQADVLLLIYLFENMFDDNIKQSNWNYYEPRTTHDSSLSQSIHSILASDLGLNDEAYKFYEMSCETDLGIHIGKAIRGLHMAACGGLWNMTVEGFGGVRIDNGKLRIEPHLPASWNSLKYQINWQGSTVRVGIDGEKMFVQVIGDGIEFVSYGREYQVPANGSLEIEVPVEETVTD